MSPTTIGPRRPLWSVLRSRDQFGAPELPLLTVVSDHGVRVRDPTEGRAPSEDLSGYRVVRHGDLVVNKLWARFGAYGVSGVDGIISPAYWVLRIDRERYEPRFLHHLLRSSAYRAEIWRRSKDMPPNGFDLPWDLFRTIQVPVLDRGWQLAVADYLDREIARIDGVVSARTQQLALVGERLEVEAATLLHAPRAPLVALRRIVDLLPGFSYRSGDFLTDPAYARLVRGINVDVGSLRWDDTVWVNESVATTTSRFALAAGDIVMGMDRPVISSGVRIAQVTEADLPALLVQRVARLRARPGLSQEYLYASLRGPALAGHFAPMFTGVSVPHVSPSQILDYEIPYPPAPLQREMVRDLVTMEERARGYQAAARHQIELLLERREALITAAVTGQLEIPGVAA